jgi:hypothetical protein
LESLSWLILLLCCLKALDLEGRNMLLGIWSVHVLVEELAVEKVGGGGGSQGSASRR